MSLVEGERACTMKGRKLGMTWQRLTYGTVQKRGVVGPSPDWRQKKDQAKTG